MNRTNCFFCKSECDDLTKISAANGYDCPYCGKYKISNTALNFILEESKHIIAGYLEEINGNRKEPFVIFRETIPMILDDVKIPKTSMQKLEKLLLYCYNKNEYIGQEFTTCAKYKEYSYGEYFYYLNGDDKRFGIAYTKNPDELEGMIYAMSDLGWLSINSFSDRFDYFILSAQGLFYAEQLLTTNINSNKVFVATEFHDDYEKRLTDAIKPACKDCGFEAFTISDEGFNNNINDEMIVGIKRSKFLIADFTHNNKGVYYEAGFASGMGLEVIKCCNKNWFDEEDKNGQRKNKLHFDIEHDNFIMYENYGDYKRQLKDRIRRTILGAKLEDSNENE